MFIFTAKINRKKVLTGAALILAIILLVILITSITSRSASKAALSSIVKTNEDRIAYLKDFGWEVSDEPIDNQIITIPKEFDEVYTQYNEIQLKQGFDLTKYSGLEATRYTYEVKNYPSSTEHVVADIIVYRNKIIAGDIQSTAMDGFMTGLKYPNE